MSSKYNLDQEMKTLLQGASLKHKTFFFDSENKKLHKVGNGHFEKCDLSPYKDLIGSGSCQIIFLGYLEVDRKVVALYDANVYHINVNDNMKFSLDESLVSSPSMEQVKLLLKREFNGNEFAYLLPNLAHKTELVRKIKMSDIDSVVSDDVYVGEKVAPNVLVLKVRDESLEIKSTFEMLKREMDIGLNVDMHLFNHLKEQIEI